PKKPRLSASIPRTSRPTWETWVEKGRPSPMISYSILFESPEYRATEESLEAPDFFGDLNLDQIINAITAGRQEYKLKPFFYASLKGIEAVRFRHEVMQDLDGTPLFQHVTAFAQR